MGRFARKQSLRHRLEQLAPKADVERNMTGLQQHTFGMVKSALTRAIVRDVVLFMIAATALALHFQPEIHAFFARMDAIGAAWRVR
jgi:hypothetical protein